MIKVILYVSGALMLLTVAYMVFQSRRTYQEAMSRQTKINWATEQLERALEQTRTGNESEIIAGIQCLSTLCLPEIRDIALSRLTELSISDNETIAKYAEWAIVRLSKTGRISPQLVNHNINRPSSN
jgi:DNA-binding TFAR19-related protein (PDSD5 family)